MLPAVGLLNTLPQIDTDTSTRAGKNLVFLQTKSSFFSFLGFNLQMPDQIYDPQAKIRPCKRHKSQFILEYHFYLISYRS